MYLRSSLVFSPTWCLRKYVICAYCDSSIQVLQQWHRAFSRPLGLPALGNLRIATGRPSGYIANWMPWTTSPPMVDRS